MLLRIALIVALVAGLASAALNFIKVREKISTLQVNLREETDRRVKTQSELSKARTDLEQATEKLKETENELATARTDRDAAVAEAEAQKKQAATLSDQLKKARQDLGDAQARVAAWDALGVMPEQIKDLLAQLKRGQEERADLSNQLAHVTYQYNKVSTELRRLTEQDYSPPMPPDLTGKVLVVDPKWNFVVLNVGENHGVVEYGQLLISRDGKLVAKVRVRSVDKDRCIANIIPGWQLSDVFEGDTVMP